jgi:molecular chaperone DnaK (HSP70)
VIDAGAKGRCQHNFKTKLNQTSPCPQAQKAAEALLQGIWKQLPPDRIPERLVLTAPVDGFNHYRNWLRQWASTLPVPELSLVDESTAAALGAGLNPGSLVLVLDMGAGTTDLSLVRLEGGEGKAMPMGQLLRFGGNQLSLSSNGIKTARVIGKAGVQLGGRSIDHWWALALGAPEPITELWLDAAEKLKCALSIADVAQVRVGNRLVEGSRRQLEQVLEAQDLPFLLQDLLDTIAAAARRAGENLKLIDGTLAVGGSSAMPWLKTWLSTQLPGLQLSVAQPSAAVVLGALAMTPALRLIDVLKEGVSLRCWDRRLGGHYWHPLFMAGQGWPTPHPLEIVLACQEGQTELEIQLGTPQQQSRAEVVFTDGVPKLQAKTVGEAAVKPWHGTAIELPLQPPGKGGEDRFRLRFHINHQRQILVGGMDLKLNQSLPELMLGQLE